MGLLFTAAELVLNAMAQWEARKGNFGSGYRAQKWSVWYLRLMQVRHGKHVTMGLDIYIRNSRQSYAWRKMRNWKLRAHMELRAYHHW